MVKHMIGSPEAVEIIRLLQDDTNFGLSLSDGAATCGAEITLVTGGVDERAALHSRCISVDSSWRTESVRPMPKPRARHAMAVTQRGEFLVVGGVLQDYDGALKLANSILAYDPKKDCWSELCELPMRASQLVAECVGDKLYVIAGDTGTSTQPGRPIAPAKCRDNVQILDLPTGSWSTGTPKPTPETGVTSAILGDLIFVVSSNDDKGKVNALVEVYDTKHDSWARIPDMPTPRTSVPCGFIGGRLFCVGGIGSDLKPSPAVEAYDISRASWESFDSDIPPYGGVAHAVHNRVLLLFGGFPL